ncbi:MAG TPA: helix-hairpin-helix domain-containing protein [Anaerolineales bacterium]|nr:helix-hairpin-helix domain-containing protein [Anaerolineales bacterium]
MLALRLLAEGGEGLNTELLWLLWSILGLFVLAIIAGWLSSLRMPKQVTASHEADSSSANEKVHDDLSKIEGIGPKVVKVLARAGITTFEELATANVDDVQNTLNKAGLQMLNPEGWIDQAKLAVQGDWDGFEKLQKKLKGGRKKK